MAEYERGKTIKLSTNFDSTEFDCKCRNASCKCTKISKELVTYLQLIRNHFGKPVIIASGYRCSAHNKAVGGTTGSNHLKGMAADIKISGVSPKEVAKYAESIGVKGIGWYETEADGFFTHIDTRKTKYFWKGHKQERITTFNGTVANKELTTEEQNLVREFQISAIADGYKFPKYGADGQWGAECARVARAALIRNKKNSGNHNLTKLAQKLLGVTVDGICGSETEAAIKKYQKQKGLKADGIIGLNTWKALLA